jgi:hypothetical protein
MTAGDDRTAEFAWRNLRDTLLYAFLRVPEVADDVVAVDEAMRSGFSWELGPSRCSTRWAFRRSPRAQRRTACGARRAPARGAF